MKKHRFDLAPLRARDLFLQRLCASISSIRGKILILRPASGLPSLFQARIVSQCETPAEKLLGSTSFGGEIF
jgi:hypothetical protein